MTPGAGFYATATELNELLGESTDGESIESGSNFGDDVVADGEYEPTEDTVRNASNVIRPVNGIPFVHEYSQVDINEVMVSLGCPETVLPNYINCESTPHDFFELFVDDEVIRDILVQTNLSYLSSHSHRLAENMMSGSTDRVDYVFNPFVAADIKTFLGIQLYQGINQLPKEKHYFRKELLNVDPPMADFMSYTKWCDLKRHLSFPDAELVEPYQYSTTEYNYSHSSASLDWFMKEMNTKFPKYVKPSKTLSVDESISLCKNRCSFTKRYRHKPIPEGITCYPLCDSVCNYCLSIILNNNDRGDTRNAPVMTSVFSDLVNIAGIQHCWYSTR